MENKKPDVSFQPPVIAQNTELRSVAPSYDLDVFVDRGQSSKFVCTVCGKVPSPVHIRVHESDNKIICSGCLSGSDGRIDPRMFEEAGKLEVRCQTCPIESGGSCWQGPLSLYPTHSEVCKEAAQIISRKSKKIEELSADLRECKSAIVSLLETKGIFTKCTDSSASLIKLMEKIKGEQKAKTKVAAKEEDNEVVFWLRREPSVVNTNPEYLRLKKAAIQRYLVQKNLIIGTRSIHEVCRTPSSNNNAVIYSVSSSKAIDTIPCSVERGFPHCYFWYDTVISYEPQQFLISPVHESNYSHITERYELNLYQVLPTLSRLCQLSYSEYYFVIYFRDRFYIQTKFALHSLNIAARKDYRLPTLNFAGKVICAAGLYNESMLVVCYSKEGSSDIKACGLDLLDVESGWKKISKLSLGAPINVSACKSRQKMIQLNQKRMGFLSCTSGATKLQVKLAKGSLPQLCCFITGMEFLGDNDHYTTTTLQKHRHIYFANSKLALNSIRYFAQHHEYSL